MFGIGYRVRGRGNGRGGGRAGGRGEVRVKPIIIESKSTIRLEVL